jgi:hypothetical protein
MEFLVGAIVAFFLLKYLAGGTLTASGLVTPTVVPSVAPLPIGSPLSPANTQAEVNTSVQAAQITQTAIGSATSIGSKLASSAASLGEISSTFATAIPIVGAAVGAVANILLAQHTARLKGAIAENQLIPASVQAFDADISELVAAYNGGTVPVSLSNGSSPACATAIQQMDTSLYSYMKSNATGPGRAWTDVPGANPPISTNNVPACNKACTAECCVFWNDLNNIMAEMNRFFTGQATQTILSKRISSNQMQFTIPAVIQPPPQYGTFARSSYNVTLTIPGNAS